MPQVGFPASINADSAKTSIYGQNCYSGGINYGHYCINYGNKWVIIGLTGHYCFIYRVTLYILAKWVITSHNDHFKTREIAMGIRRQK